MHEYMAYIPDISCEDSKRARHRQPQAAYEARFAIATEASSLGGLSAPSLRCHQAEQHAA
jgi:hypothetical protein